MATVNLFGELALDSTAQSIDAKIGDVTASTGQTPDGAVTGVPVLGVRHDQDTPVATDGQYSQLSLDEEGRLKTTHKINSFAITTGPVTTVGSTLIVDVRRASNIVLHVKNTGATNMTAGAFTFEASLDSTDGTNGTWFIIQAVRSNANTIETTTGTLPIAAGAGLAYSWEASVNAYQFARVRCTTAVTAGAVATWTIQRGSYATEPIPAAQISATQPISGTVTANLATGSAYTLNTAATTNAASIKTTAGNLHELTVSNPTATVAYVKLYNKASAPTVGTDVPVATITVPAASPNSGNVLIGFGPIGKRFATGIAIAVTGAAAATDTTAATAGVQISATFL